MSHSRDNTSKYYTSFTQQEQLSIELSVLLLVSDLFFADVDEDVLREAERLWDGPPGHVRRRLHYSDDQKTPESGTANQNVVAKKQKTQMYR
jgi:hypothetical protein